MKPFDTKGEYTPQEVKDALAGISGTRQLAFRYERLDLNNTFIEDIDYIQSCTIENNALADIKRKATFEILDTGNINYLWDRIKPYARIEMPADKSYDDVVRDLGPAIRWEMDDPNPDLPTRVFSQVPDALNYTTRETALVVTNPSSGRNFKTQAGSATVRSEMWLSYEVSTSDPFMVEFSAFSVPESGVSFEVYTSPSSDSPLTMVYPTSSSSAIDEYTNLVEIPVALPVRGFYYVRVANTTTKLLSATISRKMGARLEDSSNNRVIAVGTFLSLGHPPVIGSGRSMFAGFDGVNYIAQSRWKSSGVSIPHGNTIVTNSWVRFNTENGYVNLDLSLGTVNKSPWYFSSSMSAENGTMVFYVNFFTGGHSLSVPSAKYEDTALMITNIYDPLNRKMSLYLNGEYIGEYIDDSLGYDPFSTAEDFYGDNIGSANGSISGDGQIFLDDVSFFFRSMSATSVGELYLGGIGASSSKRSGYVEWPLGVFLLSSPSRTMVDGNVVTRTVDGYDQLIMLQEDTFSFRYSVAKGASYTDAVREVIQTSVETFQLDMTSPYWTTMGGAVVASASSVSIVGSSGVGRVHCLGEKFMQLKDANVTFRARNSTAATTHFQFDFSWNSVLSTKFFSVFVHENTLQFANESTTLLSIPYDSVNHAYINIYEKSGKVYLRTSSNGVSWTVRSTQTIVREKNQFAVFNFCNSSAVSAPFNITFDNINITGKVMRTITISDSPLTLATPAEWEPGTPKLKIINDLLSACNYTSASYSEDGKFVSYPYISPADRTSEFSYATDSSSVIVGDVNQTLDLFGIPNKWILVVADPDKPVVVGQYTNSNPKSPTSTVARGRSIVDFRTGLDAADQATLTALAKKLAFESSQVYEAIEFETANMPIHQDSDVYTLTIDGMGIDDRYSEQSWSMKLDNGEKMKHKVRRIVSI